MQATLDSTVGELLADPQAKAVVDQYVPGISSNPLIAMASGLSLRMILAMPIAAQFGLTEQTANDILAEINKQL
jgi:hypothetical protein